MADNLRYLYHILYHTTEEAQEGRASLLQQHMDRYKDFRTQNPGKLEMGGPLVDNEDDRKPIGSIGIINLSKKELEDFIQSDIFWQRDIWNKETLVIHPFISLPQK